MEQPNSLLSLCEMFFGIICACMPSAAYAARQKDSLYQKAIRTAVGLKTSWIPSDNDYASDKHVLANEIHPEPDALKSTDRKYARYFSLNGFATNESTMEGKSGDEESNSRKSGSIV
jgi:hypothetical protein